MCLYYRFGLEIQESVPVGANQHQISANPPSIRLQLGIFGFSRDQNNRDSSGHIITCICCDRSVKINMRETLHCGQRLDAFCLPLFPCVWGGGGETRIYIQLELHGCRCHYRRLCRRPVMSGLNLWLVQRKEGEKKGSQTKVKATLIVAS